MFCKICRNFMDITNNVSIPNLNPIDMPFNLVGGEANNVGLFSLGKIHGGAKEYSSSDYDVSTDTNVSKKKKNVILTDDEIINILAGKEITLDLDNYNMNDLNKIQLFNKLNSNQKTLVINRIYEKISKHIKLPKSQETILTKDSYFYCKNCGYNEKIPSPTFIFSRTTKKNNEDAYNSNFTNLKYDNTLPNTKKYNCINKDCVTHKDPALKQAVFYRLEGTYKVRYICAICDSYWNTNVET